MRRPPTLLPLARHFNNRTTPDREREREAVTITLSASDLDSAGATVAVTDPEHGTLLIVIPVAPFVWQVVYIPDANFSGLDSFTYKVTDDGGADSNVATVSITVIPVDDQSP